jgi:SMODS and SLOG-associating 2TM effector domain 1
MATDPINDAFNTIGVDQSRDYELKLTEHPAAFQPNAPALYNVLTNIKVSGLARDYMRKNAEAKTAQIDFKKTFARSNWLVLITAILISGVLAVGIVFPGQQIPLTIVTLAGFIAGAIATLFMTILKQGELLDCWMTERARAEVLRSAYFSAVAEDQDVPQDKDHTMDLLRLEYFRRYQLGIQMNFYNERGVDHKKEARKAVVISSVAIAVASFLTAASGFGGGKFTALAAFGAACTALGAFASVRESVFQNRRNAERYRKAAEVLSGMEGTLDDVRRAVQAAGQPPLLEFVKAVQEQMLLEHQQWLDAKDPQNKAIDQLKTNLDAATKRVLEKKNAAAQGQTA